MKLKKIISAVSAFAMAMSLITVANAASLGGKPTVKATFDSYEKVSDTVAFAYVNVTMDMTAAETLEVYSNELDENTWEEVIKGNGITTLGIAMTAPTGFTYTKAKSTIPTGLSVNATSVTYGPKTNAEEYWVEPVTTIKLALRVNDFDAKGDFTITNATVDGKNSAENKVWGYTYLSGALEIASCSVPSYNEWSQPAVTEYNVTATNATVSASKAAAGTTITVTPNAAPEGQEIDTVTVNGTEITAVEGVYSFEMPEADAAVVVTYKDIPAPAVFEATATAAGNLYYSEDVVNKVVKYEMQQFNCEVKNRTDSLVTLTFATADDEMVVEDFDLGVEGLADVTFKALLLNAPGTATLTITD